MFYCDACATRNGWLDNLVKSERACEICGKTETCNDTSSGSSPRDARSKAISELATACGAISFSVVPNPGAQVRLVFAKKKCLEAGMTDQEIEKAILEFGEIAREAVRKTFS